VFSTSPLWHIDAVGGGASTPSTSACSATGSRNFYASCYGHAVAAYRNHTLRKTVFRSVLQLKRISPDPLTGVESRTFECQRCGQSLTEVAKSDVDPIATAAGWVASSGLQPPK
jgi:hypothetical protein